MALVQYLLLDDVQDRVVREELLLACGFDCGRRLVPDGFDILPIGEAFPGSLGLCCAVGLGQGVGDGGVHQEFVRAMAQLLLSSLLLGL